MKRKLWIQTILLSAAVIALASACSLNSGTDEIGKELDRKVDSVLALMTLEEKLGQLTLYTSGWDVTGPVMREDYVEEIRAGRCGNIFNAHTVAYNRGLQDIAVKETRLGIPLLFGYDVIHGHKTIFPVPVAEACSWNLELMEKTSRLSALEATASGLNWTFGPMLDISRDPRWGRMTEGNGEDPYLASRIAEVRVRGIQGNDLADSTTLAACVKHFAAYGAPVAGRDYNTVEISELLFRQVYLPPYQAGIEAGAVTVMASFNDLFGVPAHANKKLLTEILREELGFEGFVVGDYTGVGQVRDHGFAADEKEAGELSFNAGLDMDMQSGIYSAHMEKSLSEGRVSKGDIDRSVGRILRVKFMLGLFDDPYRYLDEKREKEILYSQEIMDHALASARESIVLLKNEPFRGKKILPLSSPAKIAVIGPMADNRLDMLGSWHAAGDHTRVTTVLEGIRSRYPGASVSYAPGCDFYSSDESGFRDAIRLARQADVVVLAIGENQEQSGEAASRSVLDLTGVQEKLAGELISTGTPVVVLVMAERMLTFGNLNEKASSLVYAWHLGTRGGDAIAQVLSGDYNPSGKLVMSIPRNTGQVPVYYNYTTTGRPIDDNNKYTTKYLDVENSPLYPFGYGLSYTRFQYSDPELSNTSMKPGDTLEASIEITNIGDYDGEEIVQLYIRDKVGSVTRPVKELKDFRKVHINKGESKTVNFKISEEKLRFINAQLENVSEPGEFSLYIGPNSSDCKVVEFILSD